MEGLNYSSSKELIKNVSHLYKIEDSKKFNHKKIDKLNKEIIFYGWGRKKSGLKAIEDAKKYNSCFKLLEDGFIRSIGLGVNNSPSFSIIEDDIGIYYDATQHSKLEHIFLNYEFQKDSELLNKSKEAIKLIKENNISKYNDAKNIPQDFFKNDNKKVLIIAQTANDSSLEYGFGNKFSTSQIIEDAIKENQDSEIFIKIHPDVLNGSKDSDIKIKDIPCNVTIISENINPISLLKYFSKVYTKTSQMGFEAILVGCECICYGSPFYSGWGITIDKNNIKRRNRKLSIEEIFAGSYILYTKYFDYYTEKETDIIHTIKNIIQYKKNINKNKIFLFGFSIWKQRYITLFLKEYKKENIIFINSKYDLLRISMNKGLNQNSEIAIWGKIIFEDIEDFADKNDIKIKRIEDGFIRSVGLGSDLTKPYSLVIDDNGIYFDPTKPSDLEILLNDKKNFSNKKMMQESNKILNFIKLSKISKYNSSSESKNTKYIYSNRNIILVIGQVEDDASIKYGGFGMTNLKLLQEVRNKYPYAFIVYKAHPDVLSGNRIGNISSDIVLKYADKEIIDISPANLFKEVDEVHTITSLTGFEALLHGKKVYTYGIPFYAGWGLTNDKHKIERRRKDLTIQELSTAVYILYPKYINPKNDFYCSPEILVSSIINKKEKLNNFRYRVKTNIRNKISRYSQKFIRFFK